MGVCTSYNARFHSLSVTKTRKRTFLFQLDQAVLFYFYCLWHVRIVPLIHTVCSCRRHDAEVS